MDDRVDIYKINARSVDGSPMLYRFLKGRLDFLVSADLQSAVVEYVANAAARSTSLFANSTAKAFVTTPGVRACCIQTNTGSTGSGDGDATNLPVMHVL